MIGDWEANLVHKMMKYPCKACLVKACCESTKDCSLVTANAPLMYEVIVSKKKCPDCESSDLITTHKPTFLQCSNCGHSFAVYPDQKMVFRTMKFRGCVK